MKHFLPELLITSVSWPFVVALLLMLFHRSREAVTSVISSVGTFIWLALCASMLGIWVFDFGAKPFELWLGNLYQRGSYTFPITFLLDGVSAAYIGVSALLGALIVKYCRYYLHREEGYSRFFITIFLFLGGMGLIALAGTLELFFAGWEVLGASSFLLIGFYRERPSAQRAALRAFIIYRFCDVGFLLGAWLEHLVWHETKSFLSISNMPETLLTGVGVLPLIGLSVLVLIAAMGKSAQFPLSSWLPRAMEGPTPSSAIFYGALSVHAGVLLLLRTFPIWHTLWFTAVLVGGVGLITAFTATLIGRVQSNIKAQLGYASIAQIGLILVELALGFKALALFHFAANAILRCYQLLVSPSVVAHLLRVQAASPEGIQLSDWSLERRWVPRRLQASLYAFAINEGFIDHFGRAFLLRPVLAFSHFISVLDLSGVVRLILLGAIAIIGNLLLWTSGPSFFLEVWFTAGMMAACLTAMIEKRFPLYAWWAITFSHFMAASAVAATGRDAVSDVLFHLLGVIPSWLLGVFALLTLTKDRLFELDRYHGLSKSHPTASILFFLAVLGIAGFPITPVFLGEDILLHHAVQDHFWMAIAITGSFVVSGIVAMKLYSRICLGPYGTEVSELYSTVSSSSRTIQTEQSIFSS